MMIPDKECISGTRLWGQNKETIEFTTIAHVLDTAIVNASIILWKPFHDLFKSQSLPENTFFRINSE